MTDDLTPQIAANYVLGVNAPPGEWIPPGGFYKALLDTMFRADRINLARLGKGFPLLASMVDAYKNDHDGVARLRVAAETGDWKP